MYLASLNLRRKVPNCPKLTPANSLYVVPIMFGYTDILESAVLQQVMNIFSLYFSLIFFFSSMALVRERTILTERPPPVGEEFSSSIPLKY
jgi:hypothetical protein